MPAIRLTRKAIDALPFCEAGQEFYRDSELTGFGLRVGRRTKTYFVEMQSQRRTIRSSLGKHPIITPEHARRLALQRLAEISSGNFGSSAIRGAPEWTVEAAFDEFFRVKINLSPVTVQNYQRTKRLYLSGWGRRPLATITRRMVLDEHSRVSTAHGKIVANNVFRHFRSVYNFIAASNEQLPPNPVTVLTQTRAWAPERRRRSLISVHHLPAWWRAVMAESEDARDILLIALFTGMRRGEITTLRWSNIDLPGRTLFLPKTKSGEPLALPISEFLLNLFHSRRVISSCSEWVFPGRGTSGHIVEVKSFVRRVVRASGVAFTLHDLRRTFITIAESLDIPAYTLKALLNHSFGADVTGGYIVIDSERLRSPVERITNRIRGIANGQKFNGTGDFT
ncbi:MAG TPA: integrase family protein [Xanthobacteraceae bacterium]|nr:integrase family protein [Xanthobacteraceae bacterium]